jgi:hypothetical protein
MRMLRILLALVFSAASVGRATIWDPYPLADMVRDHPLVVAGKIVRVKSAWHRGEAFDIAYIRVETVLKNTLPKHTVKSEIPLWMPSTRDETMCTADVVHEFGTEGIWFLSAPDRPGLNGVPKGAFQTRYPGEVQPRKLERRVIQLLEADPKRLKTDNARLDELQTFLQSRPGFDAQFWRASRRAAEERGPEVIHAIMLRARTWRGEEGLVFVPLVALLPRDATRKILNEYGRSKRKSDRLYAREFQTELDSSDIKEAVREHARKTP